MTPEDCDDSCEACNNVYNEGTEEIDDSEIFNYQVKYVDDDGLAHTRIIEATKVYADDDHVELWLEDTLLLMIQKTSVQQVRNISVLDMNPENM